MKLSRGNTGTFRRVVKQASICLLLGAIVNVVVAWAVVIASQDSFNASLSDSWKDYLSEEYGFFIVSSRGFKHSGSHTIDIRPSEISIRHSPGVTATYLFPRSITRDRYSSSLPYWSRFHEPSSIDEIYEEAWGKKQQMVTYLEHASGWPLLTLRSRYLKVYERDPFRVDEIPTELLGCPINYGQSYNENLPLRPLWPAFAINTIFYSVILWLLFAAPFAIRKRRRIKRGLCTNCGYNLRADFAAGCSECGWNRKDAQ